MFWSDYLGVFVLGLLGSGHCVGMCGAFALAASAGAHGAWGVTLRQISYQLGKATSYVFLGVLLLLGSQWVEAQASLENFQNALGAVVGAAMIVVGLSYALELRLSARVSRWWPGGAACGAVAALGRSTSLFRGLLIGWVNGVLPCGLSLMALLYLVSFNSAAGVVAGAYVFGLATLPGLLVVALVGNKLDVARRRWLVRASGVALVAFGVLTLVRGQPAVHHWMHEHLIWGNAAGAHHGH
jgi:sulfite exporter TauE/SafE